MLAVKARMPAFKFPEPTEIWAQLCMCRTPVTEDKTRQILGAHWLDLFWLLGCGEENYRSQVQ